MTLPEAKPAANNLPTIIQGGMGVAISGWLLARSVSMNGQLGVVSGTGIDTVLVRRLQRGDPEGELEFAFKQFPVQEIARRVWDKYYVAGGKAPGKAFKAKPVLTFPLSRDATDLIVLANFVEVTLAKRNHAGKVGTNLLEKIRIATLPSLLGAIVADVDYVLMGAGIPREIPGVLDSFAALREGRLTLDVAEDDGEEHIATLDPNLYAGAGATELRRPKFVAIVSSSVLATMLAKKASPPADGFVIEGFTAGGHNAPPRGAMQLDANGEPIYGPRDTPDLQQIRDLGLPFWLAGSFGSSLKLAEALALGAQGIQVGTAFAFCDQSGMEPELREHAIEIVLHAAAAIHSDPKASPTGFPFKVMDVPESLSDVDVYDARTRICDLGYLRQMCRTVDGKLEYRCPAEPVEDFVRKGGEAADAVGRKCLCNGLLATVGLGQVRKDGSTEPPIVTAGDDINSIINYLKHGKKTYSAKDVLDFLLEGR